MIVVSVSDSLYLKYLIPMMVSAQSNIQNCKFHITLVNTTELETKTIRSIFPSACISEQKILFSNEVEKKCYCTNLRASIFYDIRFAQKKRDAMMWIDADSLVVNKWEILNRYKSSDVLLCSKSSDGMDYRKKRKYSYGRFRGGVIVINNTPKSDMFVELYNKIVDPNGWKNVINQPLKNHHNWAIWMSNQDKLDDCYENLKNKIDISILNDSQMCDPKLNDKSIIWAAKSFLKRSPKYKEKLSMYTPVSTLKRVNVGGYKNRNKINTEGWTIVDIDDGAEHKIDISREELPFESESIDAIYTSHTLEHINAFRLEFVFSEFYRTLCSGGRLRIVVPNIDRAVTAYVNGDSKYLSSLRNPHKITCLPDFPICYLMSWFVSYDEDENTSHGHVMCFNSKLLKWYVQSAGFSDIQILSYNKCSKIFQGCDLERYKDCSIYLEATKP